jgi:ABC-2 type transport system ATP-binding protein
MLKLKTVQKFYSKNLVLQIPSLQIEKGIYWLKGANGSGKTTFLKMISGLLPFDGNISFNDVSLKMNPVAYRQNVSWAEAEPLFPSFMTGMELLLLYQNIRKVSKNNVELLIELFNMKEYVNSNIETYSTGMIKKLSLVLALLGNQQLIVLDEPLITLDPIALTSLCTYIIEKYNNDETTFLMSSHQELDSRLLLYAKELSVNNQTVQ